MLGALLNVYGFSIPKETLRCILESLHSGTSARQARWQFGVSELSISFDSAGPPRVRALSEVLTRCPATPEDEVALRQLGATLFDGLSPHAGSTFDRALFDDVVSIVYSPQDASLRAAPLRFGIAVEWSAEKPPSVKCYFDLYAGGPLTARRRLMRVFERLCFGKQWQVLACMADIGQTTPICRIIGIDLSRSRERNVRLYLPGSRYTMEDVRRLLAAYGHAEHSWQFEMFNTHLLCGLSDGEAARSMLLGLVFADRLPPDRPVVKLDGYLPDHHPDDMASSQAVINLATALGIRLPSYADALRIVAADVSPSAIQSVQQYCSVDVQSRPKLNVYFRPLSNECQHMSVARRPRLKPHGLSALDTACRKAIAALERERTFTCDASTHSMRLSREIWCGCNADVPAGRVFQTAIIACALSRAARRGFEVNGNGIAADIEDLARVRCQDVRYGRRSFPDMGGLPFDAHGLAQVMQFLLLARSPRLHELCHDALELLFDQVYPDGSVKIWIADSADTSIPTPKQQFITSCRGKGPDLAVVANLSYALSLRGDDRSNSYARSMASFLVGRQQSNGTWVATWYCGPFYGTFVATRAVCAALPQSHALGRAARYLWESQRADGGWGEKMSDPTSTALALNTAVLLRCLSANGAAAVAHGAEYIVREQPDDGIWHGDAVAEMDQLPSQFGLAGRTGIPYCNDVVSTALCLESLCAAREVLEQAVLV
jgi:hypothetical protein